MSTYDQGKSFRLGNTFSVHIRRVPGSGYEWFIYRPFVNNNWYASGEATSPARAKAEAREVFKNHEMGRGMPQNERDPSSSKTRLNANPLSGPRKDARDHAIAKAVAAARRSGEDYSVWMDKQGRFHVDQAGAAPWESTIAVAHEMTGHLSYKRYEDKARPKAPKTKSQGKRDASQGKLRRELGVIGNAVWHLPKRSPWIIYWNGPGARLLFGSNKPGTTLDPIEYPGANGHYRTLKEAAAAVARFWKKQ